MPADLLNDRVLPFFEAQGGAVLRILTERGTEFCGRHDEHPYQLFLAVNAIDHTKTKVKSPQTNGICERFHRSSVIGPAGRTTQLPIALLDENEQQGEGGAARSAGRPMARGWESKAIEAQQEDATRASRRDRRSDRERAARPPRHA